VSTTAPRIAQRQDALNDQMFDVMVAMRQEKMYCPLAAFIFTHYFEASAPISDSFDCLTVLNKKSGDELGFYISGAVRIAIRLGCYDAADWLRYRAAEAVTSC
jgi:hypothetical protein